MCVSIFTHTNKPTPAAAPTTTYDSARALQSATPRGVLQSASSSPLSDLGGNPRSPSSKSDAVKPAALQSLRANSISHLQSCTASSKTTTAVATSRSSIKIADCQDRTTNSTTNQRRCTALPSKPLAVTPSSKVATLQSNSHSYATGHPRDTTTSKPSLVSAAPSSHSESNASIVSAEFKRVALEQGHHVNPSLGGSRCVHQQESTTVDGWQHSSSYSDATRPRNSQSTLSTATQWQVINDW
jgi:hypothetical protein